MMAKINPPFNFFFLKPVGYELQCGEDAAVEMYEHREAGTEQTPSWCVHHGEVMNL